MSTPSVTTACSTHRKRPSVTSCRSCSTPVCRDCIVTTAVGAKCRSCTGVPAKAAAAPKGDSKPGVVARIRGGERPPWLFPGAVGALVVVGLIGMAVFSGGGDSNPDPVGRTAAEDYPLDRTVTFVGAGSVDISGTFTLPVSRQPVAGVLVVPGFGTVDRGQVMSGKTPGGPADRLAQEVNVASSGATDPLYQDLVDRLVRADVAALRYDKRGLGKSTVPQGTAISYEELVADARAGLAFMAERIELEGKPLIVVGYDQGSVIAMDLAAEPGVAALVLVSPPGRPMADVLVDHFTRTHGAAGPAIATDIRNLASVLASGGTLPAAEAQTGHTRPMFVAGSEDFLRAVFAINPVTAASAVKVPTLILRGGADPNVTQADSQALRTAIGSQAVEQVVADADHNLAVDGTREAEAMDAITTWVTGHLGS